MFSCRSQAEICSLLVAKGRDLAPGSSLQLSFQGKYLGSVRLSRTDQDTLQLEGVLQHVGCFNYKLKLYGEPNPVELQGCVQDLYQGGARFTKENAPRIKHKPVSAASVELQRRASAVLPSFLRSQGLAFKDFSHGGSV